MSKTNHAIKTRSDDGALSQVSIFAPRSGRWLASFTIGAHTVILPGPLRTFREDEHAVTHATWVRTYPEPFREQSFDPRWLASALRANARHRPDILAIAMQYIAGSAPIHADDDPQLQIAGDAGYGPLIGGTRAEGSDFNDYLGIAWHYADEDPDPPESPQYRCLDCSGYVRMVFGYRRNLPGRYPGNIALCLRPREDRTAIPRRAHQMASHAPGVLILSAATHEAADLIHLAEGDLVFFDADPDDGPRIDHVGMYLGRDTEGHYRFVSSRKTKNGPTMGDTGGRSTLDEDGLYGRAFCAARRL